MKVSDILQVKGEPTLFTTSPERPLIEALQVMATQDVGSLLVLTDQKLVGLLTFREVIALVAQRGGSCADLCVRDGMATEVLTCTPETDIDKLRQMMLEHHVRYLPVMQQKILVGVISFYDVAKAVVENQGFENRMLKAYIRDCPVEEEHTG
jgi:CBS domain-containing protein